MAKRIEIKGTIIPNNYQEIYDWIGWEATSPRKVQNLIGDSTDDDLEVIINSGGGDVYAGSEIYTILKDYPRNVTVKIVGRAASAASIIAMAGDKVMIAPTAQIMIHNARTWGDGDHRDHKQTADVLRGWDKSLANAYRLKTGMSQEELLSLMDKETWLTAQRAVELRFADEIMFDEGNQLTLVANDGPGGMLPPQVIQKLKNIFLKEKGDDSVFDTGQQQAQQQQPQAQQQPQTPQSQHSVANQQQQSAAAQPAQQAAAPAATTHEDLIAKERARLQAIDKIAANIDPALVEEAKYGSNPMTAEQLAFKAMQEGRMIQPAVFQAAVQANAAAGTQGVASVPAAQNSEPEFDLTNVNDVNKVIRALDEEHDRIWAQRLMGGRF